MSSQPCRPEHRFREFIPPWEESSEAYDLSSDVKLSQLCSKCDEVKTWLQSNFASIRSTDRLAPHNRYNTEGSFDHHETGAMLRESAQNGCHLCTIIWENLVEMDSAIIKQNHEWVQEREKLSNDLSEGGHISLRIRVPSSVYKTSLMGCYQLRFLAFATLRAFTRFPDDLPDDPPFSSNSIMLCSTEGVFGTESSVENRTKDPLKLYYYKRSEEFMEVLSGPSHRPRHQTIDQLFENVGPRERRETSALYTGSTHCLDEASSWLSHCLEKHDRCKQVSSAVLPTRLIDITSVQQENVVRLVETNGLPPHCDTRYAALSYCWGTSSTCKVLRSNFESFKQGINCSDLPQTIKDAILVAQRFDISYIWVDALCIIQDCHSDWESEAARMCDVYQSSYVSIAAKGGSSSEAGLFSLRDPLRHTPCFLFTTDNRSVYVLSPYVNTRASHRTSWPLDTRGWVLQERILPPRIMKFGSYLSWECRESIRDEFDLESNQDSDKLIQNFFENVAGSSDLKSSDVVDLLAMWLSFLRTFSQTVLSFSTDRYVALMGVIEAIKRRTGWLELAGLWGLHLAECLLWAPNAAFPNSRRPHRTGLSPSWSWISLDCGLMFICRLEGDEELLSANFDMTPPPTLVNHEGLSVSLNLSAFLIPVCGEMTPEYIYYRATMEGWPREDEAWIQFDLDPPLPDGPFYFMPILLNDSTIDGLALKKSSMEPESFERVGKMWIRMVAPRPQRSRANSSSKASETCDSESESSSEFAEEDPETIKLRRASRRETIESYGRSQVRIV